LNFTVKTQHFQLSCYTSFRRDGNKKGGHEHLLEVDSLLVILEPIYKRLALHPLLFIEAMAETGYLPAGSQ